MFKIKKINSFFFSLLICSISFAAGLEDIQAYINSEPEIPIQERYDALSELVPGFIMLQTNSTSVIPSYIAEEYQNKIYRAMVNTDKMKPVSLDKYLIQKYGIDKARNVKDFIYELADERYPCLISGVCQPFILKSSDGYVLILSFYRFSDNGFPITVVRTIPNLSTMTEALSAMLVEYNSIVESKLFETGKKTENYCKTFCSRKQNLYRTVYRRV